MSNNPLQEIWSRATGGRNVAVHLAMGAPALPSAPWGAGLNAAKDWLLEESPLPRLLFLIGGPGGGKSHFARDLVDNFQELEPKDPNLAHRRHVYSTGKTVLHLINDASIQTLFDESTLVNDMDVALDQSQKLLACVNRGILVEELRNPRAQAASAGLEILRFISDGLSEGGDQNDSFRVLFRSEYLYHFSYLAPGQTAEIVVVNIDLCSIFEVTPSCAYSAGKFVADGYKVTQITDRMQGKSDKSNAHYLTLKSAQLASQVYQSPNGTFADPISANLENLQNPEVLRGILAVARSAEISANQRFTFRDLWGLIARLTAGRLPEEVSFESIPDWLDESQPKSLASVDNFLRWKSLAQHRFSEAMFGAGGGRDATKQSASGNPVTRILAGADPARDSRPGNSTDRVGDLSAWATPILDAFAGATFDVSPLSNLQLTLPAENPYWTVVTEFDRRLDESFFKLIQDTAANDEVKAHETAWYFRYVVRQFACANGISAFSNAVSTWIDVWTCATETGGAGFPTEDLRKRLETLIRPVRDPSHGNSSSLIPLWASRTLPISGHVTEPIVGVLLNDLALKTRRQGENIFVETHEQNSKVDEILLDFPLLREALATVPNFPGKTEVSAFTAPRLERVRAANLKPNHLGNTNNLILLVAGKEHPLIVS